MQNFNQVQLTLHQAYRFNQCVFIGNIIGPNHGLTELFSYVILKDYFGLLQLRFYFHSFRHHLYQL